MATEAAQRLRGKRAAPRGATLTVIEEAQSQQGYVGQVTNTLREEGALKESVTEQEWMAREAARVPAFTFSRRCLSCSLQLRRQRYTG